ncbi:MAG TPA: DHH family phosphoesterase [Candidatus Saccharimonadales bacterium]|nr:DHH family phosphoesterase [Candidatus Saccharimonadales bacterium]
MQNNNTPEEVLSALQQAKSIITCMDGRFDYDSLCSVLSLREYAISLGKKYDITFGKSIPKDTKELFDVSFIREKTHPNNINFEDYDLLVCLDTQNIRNLASELDFTFPSSIKKVNIDHHPSNLFYADINYVDENASSTCAVLYDLFKIWKVDLDVQTLNKLSYGILTDTGFFQHSNTSSKALRDTADMMDKGVDLFRNIWSLTYNSTLESLKAESVIFANIQIDTKRKFAYSYILQKDIKELNVDEGTLNFIPEILKKLKGINFACFIREKETPGSYTISLRSHEIEFDCIPIAKLLNGGGHKRAAGGKIEGVKDIDEAIRIVSEAVDKASLSS